MLTGFREMVGKARGCRRQPHGLLEVRRRVGPASAGAEGHAGIIVRRGKSRIELDGLLQLFNSQIGLALQKIDLPEIVSRDRSSRQGRIVCPGTTVSTVALPSSTTMCRSPARFENTCSTPDGQRMAWGQFS